MLHVHVDRYLFIGKEIPMVACTCAQSFITVSRMLWCRPVARGKKGYLEGYERKNDELKLSNKYTACSQALNRRCTTICDGTVNSSSTTTTTTMIIISGLRYTLYPCFHLFTNAFCFLYPFLRESRGVKKGFQCRSEIRERRHKRCFRVAQVLDAQHFDVLCAGDFYLLHLRKDRIQRKGWTGIKDTLNALFSVAIILIFRCDYR